MTSTYRSARWRTARTHALQRARYRCQRCGSQRHLVVHHRDGLGMASPHATASHNLIVLCHACHHDEHPSAWHHRG